MGAVSWEAASKEAAQSHCQTQRLLSQTLSASSGGAGAAGRDSACVSVCVPACATVPGRAALQCVHVPMTVCMHVSPVPVPVSAGRACCLHLSVYADMGSSMVCDKCVSVLGMLCVCRSWPCGLRWQGMGRVHTRVSERHRVCVCLDTGAADGPSWPVTSVAGSRV